MLLSIPSILSLIDSNRTDPPPPYDSVMVMGTVDVESCYATCQASRASSGTTYPAIGVDASGACICYPDSAETGTSLGPNGPAVYGSSPGACDSTCPGDSAEYCGGPPASSPGIHVSYFSAYSVTIDAVGCHM